MVGGPDPTSSPEIYDRVDHLILGEAEVTLPEFLRDFLAGTPKHLYLANNRKADMALSPIPRFDLFKFRHYLHVGIQFARGCPFRCEFCDIIELFGRVPRVKSAGQLLAEVQRLHDLGYRGHIDLVDDNFIGNKRAVKELLPRLRRWLDDNGTPFEFSTEASINLADDEELMDLMQDVGFCAIFVGIESPDEAALIATQKPQNTRRSIAESCQRIRRHGMVVNAGYIVGLDGETENIAEEMLDCIDATSAPIAMVGLLFALPNTQLSRRLATEGRLDLNSSVMTQDSGDQCVTGLNFKTGRRRSSVLSDYRRIISECYSPENYFGRVLRFVLQMDCSRKRLRIPFSQQLRDLRSFTRMVRALGIEAPYRRHFWHVLSQCLWHNPRAFRYAGAMMALYLHFGPFSRYVVARVDAELSSAPERELLGDAHSSTAISAFTIPERTAAGKSEPLITSDP